MAAFPSFPWLARRESGAWCRTGLARDPSLQAAVDELARQLAGAGPADLALVFASASYASDLPRLLPLLRSGTTGAALDGVLAAIEAERRPEITELQGLQAAEASRGELLRHQAWLRCGLALAAPIAGPAVAAHWIHQQQPLRRGIAALPAPP